MTAFGRPSWLDRAVDEALAVCPTMQPWEVRVMLIAAAPTIQNAATETAAPDGWCDDCNVVTYPGSRHFAGCPRGPAGDLAPCCTYHRTFLPCGPLAACCADCPAVPGSDD